MFIAEMRAAEDGCTSCIWWGRPILGIYPVTLVTTAGTCLLLLCTVQCPESRTYTAPRQLKKHNFIAAWMPVIL